MVQRRPQRLQQDGIVLRVMGQKADVAPAPSRGERSYLTGEGRSGTESLTQGVPSVGGECPRKVRGGPSVQRLPDRDRPPSFKIVDELGNTGQPCRTSAW
jgi:hypothetical protein